MNSLDLLRGFNATVGRVAPRHVADRARRRFMTPRDTTPRDWELPWLERAERITLRFGLSALRWGSGPTVLLMHGWEGRPTQFASLIDALVQAGYGVIALDAPAHGRSPGREANIVLFARALLEAAEDLPPLHGVIGHSMGGASAMLAIQLGLRPRALVTVAAPSRILGMLRGFARFIGLPPRAGEQFIKRVEDHAGIPAADLDVQHYRLGMPGLVAHAEDDPLVPAAEAGRIHEAWFGSQLLRLEGGGHQRVLADPRLVKAVLQLFDEVGLRASA
ncbi:alpha/beta fold hydrolase [Pseudomonas sp. No.21]|jgi:pimeloyl-ACP methyl ester carboxylesterase|uniref:alpha/beta fold hydrolase n=1 Tax=Pseudomonas TaxID=286 RepID=UPI000DAA0F82|nr:MULTISPECIES: alpha/beta fold hydrolase [Pseudomonas]MDW3713538.1 alpha/beta fold hydrolase [Pseudomonas sp. 2023EL-01195]PZE15188.1 alpha/beta hydrolase [Pseudomonas sp. 57B-090624]GJN46974.1 alpha/beta hydrolase [Pseudomonas tohonis]